jgi:hypothetical protein
VMVLPNDAGNGMWRDVDAKSHWRWCCRVMLVTVLPGRLSHDVM